jgi:hypothetical protein
LLIVRQDSISAYDYAALIHHQRKIPEHSTAASEPLWRHRALSPRGGLPVTRPLRGFGPACVIFMIASLSFSIPLRKNAWRQKSAALDACIAHSGQEIGLRIGYHQAAEFDASAPSRWRSRACLALSRGRGTVIRTGRPCLVPPKGGRTLPPPRAVTQRSRDTKASRCVASSSRCRAASVQAKQKPEWRAISRACFEYDRENGSRFPLSRACPSLALGGGWLL